MTEALPKYSHPNCSIDHRTNSYSPKHRNNRIQAIGSSFFNDDKTWFEPSINGILVTVILTAEDGWVIGPQLINDDDIFDDVGPFDSLDDAMISLFLICDRKYRS
jgi:hypothetical protein